jgi:hypothetical protein
MLSCRNSFIVLFFFALFAFLRVSALNVFEAGSAGMGVSR